MVLHYLMYFPVFFLSFIGNFKINTERISELQVVNYNGAEYFQLLFQLVSMVIVFLSGCNRLRKFDYRIALSSISIKTLFDYFQSLKGRYTVQTFSETLKINSWALSRLFTGHKSINNPSIT